MTFDLGRCDPVGEEAAAPCTDNMITLARSCGHLDEELRLLWALNHSHDMSAEGWKYVLPSLRPQAVKPCSVQEVNGDAFEQSVCDQDMIVLLPRDWWNKAVGVLQHQRARGHWP